MSGREPGTGGRKHSSPGPRRPDPPKAPVAPRSQDSTAFEPETPPHRPAWHDITAAEKAGIIAASVLFPPVGVIWGIVYSLALETARRRWGYYALATSSIVPVLGFFGTLLVLAQGQ